MLLSLVNCWMSWSRRYKIWWCVCRHWRRCGTIL